MSGAENLSLDTNVLVYAHDRNEPVKGAQARALLAQIVLAGQPLICTQVISEFYWAVLRKNTIAMDSFTRWALLLVPQSQLLGVFFGGGKRPAG
jgi:predicted nucleic acid-binding protein